MENLTGDATATTTNLKQGYVQIFNDGIWLNICDQEWGITESLVTCRQLGYRAATNSVHTTSTTSGPMNMVFCRGREHRLEFCRHDPWVVSSCSEDAVQITCSNYQGLSILSIRLSVFTGPISSTLNGTQVTAYMHTEVSLGCVLR